MTKKMIKKILKRNEKIYRFALAMYRKYRAYSIIIRKIIFPSDPNNLMVNIGGGMFYKRNWKVLDCLDSEWYSWDKRLIDYNFDLMSNERLPFEDNSVKLFYSEHTFEHIPDEACQHTLDEMYRCLRKGGGVRIVVPDIDLAYRAYANQDITFFHSIWKRVETLRKESCIEKLFLHYFATYLENKVAPEEVRQNFNKMTKTQFLDFYSKQIDPSLQKKFTGYHINWFDYTKLERMLSHAGFEQIYESTPQGSMFKEMTGKKFDIRPSWSLHVEAIK